MDVASGVRLVSFERVEDSIVVHFGRLLASPHAFRAVVEGLAASLPKDAFDLVVSVDSCGAAPMLAAAVAMSAGKALVNVSKQALLPSKHYFWTSVEVAASPINPDDMSHELVFLPKSVCYQDKRVLILDDWVWSSARLAAVRDVLHGAGASVVGVATVRSLVGTELAGSPPTPIHSLWKGSDAVGAVPLLCLAQGTPGPPPRKRRACIGAGGDPVVTPPQVPKVVAPDSVPPVAAVPVVSTTLPAAAAGGPAHAPAAAPSPTRQSRVYGAAKPEVCPPLPREARVALSAHVFAANSPCEDTHCWRYVPELGVVVVCVFDGHGGNRASLYAQRRLPDMITARLSADSTQEHTINALKLSFLEFDNEFFGALAQLPRQPGSKGVLNAGACALVALVRGRELYVANAGDCRAVLATRGAGTVSTKALSTDHTCLVEAEAALVRGRSRDPDPIRRSVGDIAAGAGPMRVAGSLAVTRALGDAYLKREDMSFVPFSKGTPFITCLPEVTHTTLTPGTDVALVMATDGVWDTVSNNLAVAAALDFPPAGVFGAGCDRSPARGGVLRGADAWRRNLAKAEVKCGELMESAAGRVVAQTLTCTANATGITVADLRSARTNKRSAHDDITAVVVEFNL